MLGGNRDLHLCISASAELAALTPPQRQSGLWSRRPTLPSSLPPQPARPEARTRDPAPNHTNPRPARLRALSPLSLADCRPANEAPVQRAEPKNQFAPLDRRKPDTGHVPRRRESGQLLLRLRCSFLRACASTELPALTPPPTSLSPLAVRAPRWASRLALHPTSHGPTLHTPAQK